MDSGAVYDAVLFAAKVFGISAGTSFVAGNAIHFFTARMLIKDGIKTYCKDETISRLDEVEQNVYNSRMTTVFCYPGFKFARKVYGV